MSETAKISIEGKEFELPVITGSEGEKAIDISKLRSMSGYITIDPGFKNTGEQQVVLHFWMGKKESYATEVMQLRILLKSALSLKFRICCYTENYQMRRS